MCAVLPSLEVTGLGRLLCGLFLRVGPAFICVVNFQSRRGLVENLVGSSTGLVFSLLRHGGQLGLRDFWSLVWCDAK